MDIDRYYPSIKIDDLLKMYEKILVAMLKNGSTHQIMMKEKEKGPLPVRKNKKVTGLMKDEKGGKIITKSVAIGPKLHSYCLQKDVHKIEE